MTTAQTRYAVEAISEADIRSRVHELGSAISNDYQDRNPLFVVVMIGAIPFAADLVRSVTVECEIEFLMLNRFGESGRLNIAMDLATTAQGRNVILVEDIVDTGLSLTALRGMMFDRGAATVSTAALTDKTTRRVTAVPIEYRGFEVGDEYLIGYGLDWKGLYRGLRSIWAMLDMEAFVENPKVLQETMRS